MKKSVLFFITIIIGGLSFAQNRSDRQKYEDLEAYARAFGIIRYYSPNPHVLDWEEIDWAYICYKDVKAILSGGSVKEVIENLTSVMAPEATVTSEPKPSSRKIQGHCSEYSYLLHRGCGEIKVPKISKLLNKELRDYKPFSIEMISCSDEMPVVENAHDAVLPLEPSELPRPDSIYCYRLSPDLYLNIPHAERADAFSNKAVSGMLKSAEDHWHGTMESYGKNFRDRAGGLMGERAFKVSSAILRWNIIQHFYPYHEEDGLHWEGHLQNMMQL